ncbi:tyrosine-protein kinase ITK/TSK isoform 2-T2 [Syngnathus typhle]
MWRAVSGPRALTLTTVGCTTEKNVNIESSITPTHCKPSLLSFLIYSTDVKIFIPLHGLLGNMHVFKSAPPNTRLLCNRVSLSVFKIVVDVTMFSRVILDGTMIKKSQQKRKTSPSNYKERFFVLDTQELKYSECRTGRKPILKGCIKLCSIKCVDMVFTDLPIPCDYKYPFQVFHDNHYLYIFAPDNDCRLKWVHALKEETKNNNLVEKYHPQFWIDGKWKCCQQSEKLSIGCQVYDPMAYGSKKPLPEIPDSEVEMRDTVDMVVIALQNYTPFGDRELALQKDKEYTLITSSHPLWWIVRDEKGNDGFVPRTHIAEKSGNDFERFEWYNKNIARREAEDVLIKEGKEGAFMVRNSRQTGFYIVSVFTKALGSNGEKQPCVKHYQIRRTDTGESSFYLAEKYLFRTIPELIHYHQHNAAGLITRLRHPVTQTGGCSQEIAAPFKDEWEVDPEEITFGQELGSGQFGMVLSGQWRDKKVALKIIREDYMSDEEFKEEARVMIILQCVWCWSSWKMAVYQTTCEPKKGVCLRRQCWGCAWMSLKGWPIWRCLTSSTETWLPGTA